MRRIGYRIADGVDIVFLVYKNVRGLRLALRRSEAESATNDTGEVSAFTVVARNNGKLSVCIGVSADDTDHKGTFVHEAHHAADHIWDAVKRRKDYKSVNSQEYRAYMTQDIATMLANWKKSGWKEPKSPLKGTVLSQVSFDWDGIQKAK